jgi:hypothetical protein
MPVFEEAVFLMKKPEFGIPPPIFTGFVDIAGIIGNRDNA